MEEQITLGSGQGETEAPLPDRKHFKHVFVPSVNLPLFITRASLVLMPSWDFFDCRAHARLSKYRHSIRWKRICVIVSLPST